MSRLRIHRYIFREIAIPTGLALTVFTFVLLLGRILKLVELVITKGVPPADIARLFLCIMPSFLAVTLPLSTLLGIMLGFGRLSADREIMACKSTGISLYQLARPAVALGLLASLLTGLTTLALRPAAETAYRQQLFEISASRASIALQPNVFNEAFEGLTLYANAIDDRTGIMRELFISDEREDSVPAVIVANRGHIAPNRDTLTMVLRLQDGVLHRRLPNSSERAYQTLQFSTYDLNLGLEQTPAAGRSRKGKKPKEMGLRELMKDARKFENRKYGKMQAELHTRFALPWAPLLFALVGVPLGIQPHRSGRGGAFALGLFTFLCYYLLSSLAETLVIESQAPVMLIWLPNLIFLAAGLVLFRRVAEEKSLAVPLAETILHPVLRRFSRPRRRP